MASRRQGRPGLLRFVPAAIAMMAMQEQVNIAMLYSMMILHELTQPSL